MNRHLEGLIGFLVGVLMLAGVLELARRRDLAGDQEPVEEYEDDPRVELH